MAGVGIRLVSTIDVADASESFLPHRWGNQHRSPLLGTAATTCGLPVAPCWPPAGRAPPVPTALACPGSSVLLPLPLCGKITKWKFAIWLLTDTLLLLAGPWPWRGPFLGVLCPTLTSLGDTVQDTGARRVSRVTLVGFFHPLSAACRHRAGAKALQWDTGTHVPQPREVSEGGTGWQSHLSLPFNERWV